MELVLINRLSKKECVDTFTSAKLACPSEIYSTLTDFEGKVSWQYTSRRSVKGLSAGGLTEEELNLLKHVRGTRSDTRARLSFLTSEVRQVQGVRKRRGQTSVPTSNLRSLGRLTDAYCLWYRSDPRFHCACFGWCFTSEASRGVRKRRGQNRAPADFHSTLTRGAARGSSKQHGICWQ